MTKSDRENWKKGKGAEDAGYDPKPFSGMAVHSQNTPKHEFVKFVLCYVLDEQGRRWDTETKMNDGRVDVFDFGPDDGKALVYEVETGLTEQRKLEKVEQYCKGPVRDVLVLDPADVPDDLHEAIAYVENQVVVG